MLLLNWYKASINMAHAGAGQDNGDETVYIQAPDLLTALGRARRWPGSKKSKTGQAGNNIRPAIAEAIPTEAARWYYGEQNPKRGGKCYTKPAPS